jgi:subtilisin family serine protease
MKIFYTERNKGRLLNRAGSGLFCHNRRPFMCKKIKTSLFVFLLALSGTISAQNFVKIDRPANVPPFLGFVSNEFIVVLKEDVPTDKLDVLGERFKVNRIKKQFPTARNNVSAASTRQKLSRYYKIKFQMGTLEQAMEAYRNHPLVERVEPIGIHTVCLEADDPYYRDSSDPDFPHSQWHYWDSNGIKANLAWNITTGEPNVAAAVLDTGVRYFHLDLGGNNPLWGPGNPAAGGNIWLNPAEIPANGIDDDNNGYIDDTIGWDFVSSAGGAGVKCLDQDCGSVDNNPDDGDGHGTHVAGTISAITNNARAVAGVAGGFSDGTTNGAGNGVKIIPLRIGYHARYQGQITGIVRMDWAAEAMTYVADLADANNPNRVNIAAINCSWSSSNTGGIDAAVDNLLAQDVMLIHAAGNSNSSSPDYLGSKAGVMNVAATDILGHGASFTNYGSWVDLAAPGVDIVSTYAEPDDPNLNHHYIALLSGTSMAAPHAAAVAALLESFGPLLSGPDKFAIMVDTTAAYDDSRYLGSGILDAENALEAAADVLADFSGNGSVGFEDLRILSLYWLGDEPSVDIAPHGGDGIINFLDFAQFAQSWE